MQNFLENSHPAVQSLESLQQRAMEEFSKTASYFGEDGKATNTEAFFGIFSEFMAKFEVSKKDSDIDLFIRKTPVGNKSFVVPFQPALNLFK